MTALLELANISKSFPGVKALEDVHCSADAGQVHALVGENGAGKSTLIKVISGVHPADSGTIHMDGQMVRFRGPHEAQAHGIATIYQELSLYPELSVAENIFMGHSPMRKAGPAEVIATLGVEKGALRATFRPEFLNRIDEIIVFHSLDEEALSAIVDLLVADLAARLADHDLELVLTPAAKALIGREGNDPHYGARPLKRAVQRLLENPLARALLEGKFKSGSTITADADPVGGTIVCTGSEGETFVSEAAGRRDPRATGEPVGAGLQPNLMDLPSTEQSTDDGKKRLN